MDWLRDCDADLELGKGSDIDKCIGRGYGMIGFIKVELIGDWLGFCCGDGLFKIKYYNLNFFIGYY